MLHIVCSISINILRKKWSTEFILIFASIGEYITVNWNKFDRLISVGIFRKFFYRSIPKTLVEHKLFKKIEKKKFHTIFYAPLLNILWIDVRFIMYPWIIPLHTSKSNIMWSMSLPYVNRVKFFSFELIVSMILCSLVWFICE